MTRSSPRRRLALPRMLAVVVAAIVVVLAGIVIGAHDAVGESPASVSERPADAFALTVTYVFDGDTIEARVVAPNDIVRTRDPVRVRLIGIDTPEGTPSPECWADEARAHLRALLPEGSTVWAAADIERRDPYDRTLLYLWTEDGRFVNHELVAAGDAEAMLVEPNGTHYELFVAAEASAHAAGVGQWGACD